MRFTPSYKLFFLALVSSLVLTFGFNAKAAVIIKAKHAYYPVTGKNGAEIFKSFAATKRKLRNKHLFSAKYAIADTDFKIEIGDVKKTERGGYCRITDADIILNVVYTYPNWVDEEKSNTAVRTEWAEFMKYVVWHEEQHVKYAKEFAANYIELLRKTKFPLLANCTSLPKEVRKKRNAMHKAHLRRQNLFDRKEGGFSGLGKKHLSSLRRVK